MRLLREKIPECENAFPQPRDRLSIFARGLVIVFRRGAGAFLERGTIFPRAPRVSVFLRRSRAVRFSGDGQKKKRVA